MKNQFVTYEIAKKLKKLGFTDDCLGWYMFENNLILMENPVKNDPEYLNPKYTAAPLWQQAIDWLRTKHSIDVKILRHPRPNDKVYFFIIDPIEGRVLKSNTFDLYTYEQAREAAILKALELINQ